MPTPIFYSGITADSLIDGICPKCDEFYPCACGEYCPVCLGVVNKIKSVWKCSGCGRVLIEKQGV